MTNEKLVYVKFWAEEGDTLVNINVGGQYAHLFPEHCAMENAQALCKAAEKQGAVAVEIDHKWYDIVKN